MLNTPTRRVVVFTLLGSLVLMFGAAVAGQTLYDRVWDPLYRSMRGLASLPMGYGGLVVAGSVVLAILAAFLDTSPVAGAVREFLSKRGALATQVAVSSGETARVRDIERQLADCVDANRYGATVLSGLQPIDALQLGFLKEHMAQLRTPASEAGNALQNVLMKLMWRLWEEKPRGAHFELASFVTDHCYKPSQHALARFAEEADAGHDCRESFARFYAWYSQNVAWVEKLAAYSGIEISDAEHYEAWSTLDEQFRAALAAKLKIPQFVIIEQWLLRAGISTTLPARERK